MKCSHCGNILSPGSTYCTACGTSTAAPATPADAAPDAPRGAGDFTQPGGLPASAPPRRAQTAFYGRYGSRGNVVLPSPSSLSVTTLTASDEGKNALVPPLASTISPAPIPPISAPVKAITPTLPPKPRRPLAGRLVALGGILVLLALLGSLSAFGYNVYKKNLTETRATAAADTRLQATGTAAAQASATASALLFTDTLASNANGWIENGTTAFFTNGQYHLHNPNPTTTFDSYYQQQLFDNFKIQITVTAYTNANPGADVPYAYGLILRADPTTPANKYVFFVSPAGTYDFARHDANSSFNNGWTDLSPTPWASSSAIHTGKGATNTLTVIANGANFTLFINGQPIETDTDTSGPFVSGWIGVVVEGADMEAGFSNLHVYGPGA
jgi:hypothetical protein